MDQFSLATIDDLKELNEIDIPYNFKKNISLELSSKNSEHFRWIVKRENNEIIGFHRSLIVSGWGFLSGIFIKKENIDQWLLPKLVAYAINDLKTKGCSGLIAWDDSPPSYKTTILKRYGFSTFPSIINRIIFDREGIERLLNNRQEKDNWLNAQKKDIKHIVKLTQMVDSYIKLSEFKDTEKSLWLVNYKDDRLIAAINYWIHGNTLEIHFSFSEDPSHDITEGIQKLATKVKYENAVQYLKVNLEPERILSFIRLTSFGALTYQNGYKNTCLVRSLKNEQRGACNA
jgi:hypothetical protein